MQAGCWACAPPPPGPIPAILPVSEDFFLIEVCGLLSVSRTRARQSHPDSTSAMLPDRGHISAIKSSHPVEPTVKWPFLGYVACGTDTLQWQSCRRATDNSVRGWTCICRRVHADCVRKVTAVGTVSLVHRKPCVASTLSSGVPYPSSSPKSR